MFSGMQQVGLARARRAAALRHAAWHALAVNQDHRAAGRPLGQRVMSDLDAVHFGQAAAARGRQARGFGLLGATVGADCVSATRLPIQDQSSVADMTELFH